MLHAYASFLGNAPTTPAGPVAQHINVKPVRAEMMMGGTDSVSKPGKGIVNTIQIEYNTIVILK